MTARSVCRSALATAGLVACFGSGPNQVMAAEGATIIELSQIPCQFVQSENGIDHGFKSAKKADCESINERTGEERLTKSKVLKLKPGKYVFRVTNMNVPYELGFWLRGASLIGRATLPSVSGGGLVTGHTQDYEIELVDGEYLYSCPLNPTPDYKIVVEG
ncbi:MAG: hypothetical protein GEV13_27590 [Rhodospirillales bacterium]|nr:hypothetical protein [Rhodospirillales bacterium]